MQGTQATWIRSLSWEGLLEEENGSPLPCSCLKSPMDSKSQSDVSVSVFMLKTKLLKRLFVFEVEALLSRVQLFSIPWTVTCQAPLTMGFPRPESWSG